MRWSAQQDRALVRVNRWRKANEEPIFRLFGYAGTGKTSLAREIGQSSGTVHFVAMTGKAAHRLRERGCEPVSTIHRLIYASTFDHSAGKYVHALRPPPTRLSVYG